jgi:excisionase family DNA binding protein
MVMLAVKMMALSSAADPQDSGGSSAPAPPYTLADVAKLFGVEPQTVRYWVYKGHLAARKDGRRWVVEREIADGYITSGTTPARGYQRTGRFARQEPQDIDLLPEPVAPTRPGRSTVNMVED